MAKANPIEVQKHLSGVDYPAGRDDLVAAARSNGADDNALKPPFTRCDAQARLGARTRGTPLTIVS
ncbi:DUF2795 domain-containing protein [Amycolatopsis sp. YIM 10]|uniref:DUF2795 domain-containing protein n=1 Tax=Amycolatopsis sp. YIM 10 TaxID=2653857 RepID=UPI0012907835|nr:DUF2795 domain-containing protein [Amycolatopsis sp. YIM 10]QFU89902.1 hypothetical protein YIM_23625 [Amycolatopsis sp. YIM 10]